MEASALKNSAFISPKELLKGSKISDVCGRLDVSPFKDRPCLLVSGDGVWQGGNVTDGLSMSPFCTPLTGVSELCDLPHLAHCTSSSRPAVAPTDQHETPPSPTPRPSGRDVAGAEGGPAGSGAARGGLRGRGRAHPPPPVRLTSALPVTASSWGSAYEGGAG